MPSFLLNFFQHPAFLWSMLGVLIPLVIEWLLRRRRRRIPFAAMRFLLNSDQPQKIRMQDRLLLILRMIILGLIILALARPLIRPEDVITVDRSDRFVLMLFDSTYSNAQRLGNATAFSTATRMASDVLQGLPEGVPVTIGALRQNMKEVLDWTTDKSLIQEKLDRLKVSHGSGKISDGLAWLDEKIKEKTGEGEPPSAEIYIFSDMQVQTWVKGEDSGEGSSARGLVPRLCEKAQIFVAATGGESTANVFVTRFEPADKVLSVGVTTEFIVEIETANFSSGQKISSKVSLYVGKTEKDFQKRHFQTVEVGEEGTTIRLPYKVLTSGEQIIRVVIEGDESPLDNERLYLAEIREAMKILVIDDHGSEAAQDRSSVFWEYAVAPPSAPGREPVSAFTVKTMDWSEAQKENFNDYGAVILVSVAAPSEGMASRLKFYVREGGNMIVFAGEGIESYPYEKLYDDGKGPLPAAFRDKKETNSTFQSLLKGAESLEGSQVKFFRPAVMKSGGATEIKTIGQLSGGEPVVIGKKYGEGQAVTVVMDPGLSWSSLPLSVEYPIFVQELLRHVLGDPNRFVNLKVGDEFSQPVMISTQQMLLKTPDGGKVRLAPETVEGEDIPRIRYANTDTQGLYRLEAPAGVLARERFVVNLNPDEGDMTMWSESDFHREIAEGVAFLSPNENIVKRVESMHSLREFAGMILFLVLLMLLAESVFAMRFGLRKG